MVMSYTAEMRLRSACKVIYIHHQPPGNASPLRCTPLYCTSKPVVLGVRTCCSSGKPRSLEKLLLLRSFFSSKGSNLVPSGKMISQNCKRYQTSHGTSIISRLPKNKPTFSSLASLTTSLKQFVESLYTHIQLQTKRSLPPQPILVLTLASLDINPSSLHRETQCNNSTAHFLSTIPKTNRSKLPSVQRKVFNSVFEDVAISSTWPLLQGH